MISCASIWAVVLRHARVWRRDPNLLLVSFYWPILDILIWGFLGTWISRSHEQTSFQDYTLMALLGILLWQVVGRGSITMGISLSEELWCNNVVNLFSLPLRTIEWMIAIVLFKAFITTATTMYCMLLMSFLYDISMWHVFTTFLVFVPPLFLSGVWIGFTSLQVLILLGRRGVEFSFVIGWFFVPFSGAFYPLDVLPGWAQKISALLPMSYVFQGMRDLLMHQQDPTANLIKGYILSILYAAGAMLLFVYCFNRSKRKGLARLAD